MKERSPTICQYHGECLKEYTGKKLPNEQKPIAKTERKLIKERSPTLCQYHGDCLKEYTGSGQIKDEKQ
jgi:hypothetical protein